MTKQGRDVATGRHVPSLLAEQRGIVVVVVMMFCMIFLIVGLALYWLSAGQIRATETERKDVKAFNVAEAGVDAGMLALKLDWPFTYLDGVYVDGYLLKTTLQGTNPELWDPTRGSPSEFLQVTVYDNSNVGGDTVTVPPDYAERVMWDANQDGKMFVDATSNVDDDRHRILLLAERQVWNLYFPVGTALFSTSVDSNGLGLGIEIEDGGPPVYYDVNDVQGKGIDEGEGVEPLPTSTSFDSVITPAILRALEGIATQKGTYYEGVDAGTQAGAYLTSGDVGGSVVYVKNEAGGVTIELPVNFGGTIGGVDEPVILVIDAADGSECVWDMGGSSGFYGVVVVLGDTTLRGSSSTHGAIFCEGTLLNKGVGSEAEILYNYTVIQQINRQYVLSVNIVPNSWEEYSFPSDM
jgi:hypothetical protein